MLSLFVGSELLQGTNAAVVCAYNETIYHLIFINFFLRIHILFSFVHNNIVWYDVTIITNP